MAEDTQEVQERTEKQLDGQQSIFDYLAKLDFLADPVITYPLQETKADDGSSTIEAATRKENVLQENSTGTPGPSKPGRIRIEYDLNVDPKLDPNSPQFDFKAWAAAMEASKGELERRTQEALQRLQKLMRGFIDIDPAAEMNLVTQALQEMSASITELVQSDIYAAIKEKSRSIDDFIEAHREDLEAATETAEAIKPLLPYLWMELESLQDDPQYINGTLQELVNSGFDDHGQPVESPWRNAIERAMESQKQHETDTELTNFVDHAAQELAMLQSIKPQAHTMPNNPLMNALQQKEAINAGPFDLTVSNAKGRRKEITNYTIISYDPGDTAIKITDAKLTEYERQVSDAIVSLWQEAEAQQIPPVFTTDMVYRAMPGGGEKAPPAQRSAIEQTIEKLRRLHISMDATEEMRKRGYKDQNGNPIAQWTIDDFFLSAKRISAKARNGGQTFRAYRLNTEPIMLTYSKMTDQLATVDAKYIEVRKVKKGQVSGESVMMNAERQAMCGYMLRRIEIMKRAKRNKDKTQNTTILFDTLFKAAGVTTDNRVQAGRYRAFCFEVLDYWKATAFIKGYEKQTKGKSITGIILDL